MVKQKRQREKARERERERESKGSDGVQLSSAQLLVKRRVIGAQQQDKRESQHAFRDAAQRISPPSCFEQRPAWRERERQREYVRPKRCIENKRETERTQERLKSEVASALLIQLMISVGLIWYTRSGSCSVLPSQLPACQN